LALASALSLWRSGADHTRSKMIRIAINVEAFEAIAWTLPLGNVSVENKTDEEGERLIWLDSAPPRPSHGNAEARRELQRAKSYGVSGSTISRVTE
jgi:hypothetical protein